MLQWILSIPTTLIYPALAGAAGGLALFLLGIRRGTYKNNQLVRKASIEILGGAIVAFFATLPFSASEIEVRVTIAFVAGLSWTVIIQRLRSRVTAIVEAAIGSSNNPIPNKDEGGD